MNYWWHSLWGTEHLPAFMKLKKLRWVSAIPILQTAQSQADSKQFGDITPFEDHLSPACYLGSVCTWSHITLICNIFLLPRGTVNTPGTEFNNFSNHILLPFQRWGGNAAQNKGQQYWSQGKTTLNCDLQHMCSGRICPWESKEGIQALLFQDTLSLCLTCL